MDASTSLQPLDDLGLLAIHLSTYTFLDASYRTEIAERRAWNAARPVAKLPVETLCYAFMRLDVPECVVVSHVCHHWREIVLDLPSLWTTIDNTATNWSEDALQTLLLRSKDAPLDLYCEMQCLGRLPLLNMRLLVERFREQLHRVRKLQFVGSPFYAWHLCRVSSAPHLRELYLRMRRDARVMHPFSSDNHNDLADAIFGSPLSLRGIKTICPALTSLNVGYSGYPEAPAEARDDPYRDIEMQCNIDYLILSGSEDWIANALADASTALWVSLKINDPSWGVISQLLSVGPLDELAITGSSSHSLVVDVSSGGRRRVLYDINGGPRNDSGIPAMILPLAAWMATLVSLTLYDYDWDHLRPASAPLLRNLTVVAQPDPNSEDDWQSAWIYHDENVFSWDCPSLDRVTRASNGTRKHRGSDGSSDDSNDGSEDADGEPVDLEEARLITFLEDMLGFSDARKLDRLHLVNIDLIDEGDECLAFEGENGSGRRVTDAYRIVRSITTRNIRNDDGND